MLFAREAHYQPLTQISFTSDEVLLFTGGEDAVTHIWRVIELVDFNLQSEQIMPVQTWNEHTLAVTGIICGSGTAMTSRVYTASLDKTVKVLITRRNGQSNSGLGHMYFVLNDNNSVPKCSKHPQSRPCRTSHICWHFILNNTSIQPLSVNWGAARSYWR